MGRKRTLSVKKKKLVVFSAALVRRKSQRMDNNLIQWERLFWVFGAVCDKQVGHAKPGLKALFL